MPYPYNQDLRWNADSVKDFRKMFSGAKVFNQEFPFPPFSSTRGDWVFEGSGYQGSDFDAWLGLDLTAE